MKKTSFIFLLTLIIFLLTQNSSLFANVTPPQSPVKLVFIHHSTGENWLADDNGGLGTALMNNNYFVSDTNYGWGPNNIGDTTDLGNWYDWFRGTSSSSYLSALYSLSDQNSSYSRLGSDPGGENKIIMFKSCFPNSNLSGNPNDPPTTGSNPLRSQNADSEYMTVANAKGIYVDLLNYFATRQDKLFVVITAPPLRSADTDATAASNARAFNNWLINDWLDGYQYKNVAVFDFYNVMTGTNNHHRWNNNAVQHIQSDASNMSAYPTEDSHPNQTGNTKATTEFVPLLNYFYNTWGGGSSSSGFTLSIQKSGAGSGTITSGDGIFNCGAGCSTQSHQYSSTATTVTLTALAASGSIFSGWGGTCVSCGANASCLVSYESTHNPDMTCQATFTSQTPVSQGDIISCDINNDNKDDVIFRSSSGVIKYSTDLTNWTQMNGTLEKYIACGDLNGDGMDDIIGMNNNGSIYYTLNKGSSWLNISGSLSKIFLADMDGNGVSDILGLNAEGYIYITYNLQSWTPIPGLLNDIQPGNFNTSRNGNEFAGINSSGYVYYTTDLYNWTNIPGALSRLFSGEINGDGKADLMGLNSSNEIYYTTDLVNWTNIPGGLVYITTGDVNGDGKNDIIGLNSANNIYYTTNLSGWTNIPGALTSLSTGDLNGDGKDDVAGLGSDGNVYYTLNLGSWTPITGGGGGGGSSALLQSSDFQYLGAFRLPDDSARPLTFEYGGNAMTYNPNGDSTNDGYPGSLFISGHERMPYGELPNGNQVAEITIPAPVNSRDLGALNYAQFIQRFKDVTGGLFATYDEIPRMGMEYLNNSATGSKIHLAFGQHFHMSSEDQTATHAWFDTNLSSPNTKGAWYIGNQSLYSVNEYIFAIPQSWADTNAGGKPLATGRSRSGGLSGMGPDLLAYKPWDSSGNPLASGTRLSETVLLLYENSSNTSNIERCLNNYQAPDEWHGGAWITTSTGKTAVLFAGTKSNGTKYWYGYINAAGSSLPCVDPEQASEQWLCRLADGTPCSQSDRGTCAHASEKGWWSTKFDAQIILYNPDDLAKVASGQMQSYEPQPYTTIDIDNYLYLNPSGVEINELGTGDQRRYRISDVAYDRTNNLLYVTELFADGAKPVVHVWRVQ